MTPSGVTDPGLIHEVLRNRPAPLRRSTRLSSVIDELSFRGVFTAEGERWKRQRKLVMRALTPEAVRHFFPIIRTVTYRLHKRWDTAVASGQTINVPRDLKRYSVLAPRVGMNRTTQQNCVPCVLHS